MSFIINPYQFGSLYSTRTVLFAAATGITDVTILGALSTMDDSLVAAGLDTKMKALYPFVGGTATTHKYNFWDARDLDAAFRLSFSGGWTHSSTGALPNGTNGAADTFLIPNTILSLNSTHLSYYSRTNNSFNGAEMGGNSAAAYAMLMIKYAGTLYGWINASASGVSASVSDSSGFFTANRNASNVNNAYRNGTKLNETSTASFSLPISNIYIGCRNDGAPAFFSNRECAFSSIGLGFSDTDQTNYNSIVQTFQTTLGRNV